MAVSQGSVPQEAVRVTAWNGAWIGLFIGLLATSYDVIAPDGTAGRARSVLAQR